MTRRMPPGRFDSRGWRGPTRLTRRGSNSGSGSARLDLSQKGDLPSSGERVIFIWSKVADARNPKWRRDLAQPVQRGNRHEGAASPRDSRGAPDGDEQRGCPDHGSIALMDIAAYGAPRSFKWPSLVSSADISRNDRCPPLGRRRRS